MADTTTTTETIKFNVNAREFLQKLDRISTRLGAFGDNAASAAEQLRGAFRVMSTSATGLNTAIKQAGEGTKDVVQRFSNLANALAKLNREASDDRVLALGYALEFLNDTIKETGSIQRFSRSMEKLSAAMKTIKKEANDAAKAVAALKKAADSELGLNRVRTMTPEAQKRDVLKTKEAEIRLREREAKAAEAAAARVEKADRRAGRSARKRATETVGAFKSMERAAAGLRVRLLNLRTGFAFLGGAFLTKRVITFAGDFEEALARVNTIIQDQSEVQLPRYKEQLLGLAQEGPQDLIDLSNALYQIISSGIPTVEGAGGAFEVLATAQKASVAGVSTLTQAADALVTTLNGFRRESLSSTDAADKLFATVRLGRTRFDLLARSVGRVAALADDFGVGSDELLGGLAAITRVIPSTSEAVTQLRALITGIVRPTQRASEVLGLLVENRPELNDLLSAGGLQRRGLVETLRQLTEVTGGSADAITKLFPNVRALAASAILGGRNFEQFEEIVQGVADSGGAADAAFNKMRFTFNNVAAVFRNKLATILIRIGDQIMPKLVELFERLGAFLLKNQDKIVKFFTFLADVLITLVNLAQKFANRILGLLAGAATGKILAWFATLIPKVRDLLGAGAKEVGDKVGAEFSASLVSSAATVGGAVIGAAAGKSLFDIQTDVEGELALSKTQPIISEDLARQAGFKTAEQFKDALNTATTGRGLLVDGPALVDEQFFQDAQKQINLDGLIESAETVNDLFQAIRLSVKRTGSDFGTLGDQITNAFAQLANAEQIVANMSEMQGLSLAATPGDSDDIVANQLADIREGFARTADLLEARSPQVSAALRSIASDTSIRNVDQFREAMVDLRRAFPGVEAAALRLADRVGTFQDFLPGERFGEQSSAPEFELVNVRAATDPFFDRLNEQQDAILAQLDETQRQVRAKIEPVIEAQTAAESRLNEVLKERDNLGANSPRYVEGVLAAQEKALREVIAANKELLDTEQQRFQAQETASKNQLDGIRELIAAKLRDAELERQRVIVQEKLAGVAAKAARLRSSEIRDNGLLERIRNQTLEAQLDAVDAQIRISELANQQLVTQTQAQLEQAKTVGAIRLQERLENQLVDVQEKALRLERENLVEARRFIRLERDKLAGAKTVADTKRIISNLDKQIAEQDIAAQNARARGDDNALKAAQAIAGAYRALRKEASGLVDANLIPALDTLLGKRLQLRLAESDAELNTIDNRIAGLLAAAAVRPNAVVEFEQAVLRAKLAAQDTANAIVGIIISTKDVVRQIADTDDQIRIRRRENTFGGQTAELLTQEISADQFRAARAAIARELDQVNAVYTNSILDLQDKARSETEILKQQIAENKRQQGELASVVDLFPELNLAPVSDKLAEDLRQLEVQLDQLGETTARTKEQLETEQRLKQRTLELSEQELEQNRRLADAKRNLAKANFELQDTLTFGGASVTRFGTALVNLFDDDLATQVVALSEVLETVTKVVEKVNEKFTNFLPNFSGLIDQVFDSLLQGPQRVIDGLSTAFTGVLDILFGGFQEAIQSILGFDFFGDQDRQERDTLPSVDLRGRFFDQRPEERARVLDEIRAQGEARDRLAAGNASQAPLGPADQARQILERAIETAVKATEVIVEILPELLETFLEKVIDLLPSIAGKLAQAVAAGIRVLADKFDEILISVLKALEEALPVLLESIGEAVPIIIASLVARLPEIVYRVLKALGLGVGGLFSGLGKSIGLFHSGGKVKGTQRQPGLASMMQSLGAPGFATGGTVTPASLTQGMLNRRLQRDEVPAVLQAGERVVSRQELARMGGEAALNQFLANGGAAGGGGSFDGVIQGLSPQAAAAFAQAFAQAMRGFMGQQVAYNPNLGARAGRGRSF